MTSKIKMFVNSPDLWNSFCAEVDERIEATQKKLGQQVEPHLIYRAQGELQALESLKRLRDKVNEGRYHQYG